MSVITKIEQQKNKARVNIYVDEAFFCGMNKETAIICGLKENKQVDENELKEAIKQSEVKSAFDKSIDYISRRMHSKKELTDKLSQKGFEKEVVELALKKLEDYHYVDDFLFAKQFVNSSQKYSKKILEQKLFQKGVSRDIVFEIFSDCNENDEYELCLHYAMKYIKNKQINTYEDMQKLQAHLARKGFDFDLIKRVCKTIKGNEFNEDNSAD